MKTATLGVRRIALLILFAGILPALPEQALGNLFVAVQGSFFEPGHIGEYTNSGATINASLITGLPASEGIYQITVSDGFIYVANLRLGTIGKYTTSGATINPALISGLDGPFDVKVSGGFVYVAEAPSFGKGRVGKYTTLGATINASLITGLQNPAALAVSGTSLFVGGSSAIGLYTTSGETVNASLISAGDFSGSVTDLEVSGSTLFVNHNFGDETKLAKYNVNGTLINPDLIGFSGSIIAISGTDLFTNIGPTVAKFTTSGALVTYPLIPLQNNSLTGIAVDGSATVPESLSSFWFGLTTAGLLGFARLLRTRSAMAE